MKNDKMKKLFIASLLGSQLNKVWLHGCDFVFRFSNVFLSSESVFFYVRTVCCNLQSV